LLCKTSFGLRKKKLSFEISRPSGKRGKNSAKGGTRRGCCRISFKKSRLGVRGPFALTKGGRALVVAKKKEEDGGRRARLAQKKSDGSQKEKHSDSTDSPAPKRPVRVGLVAKGKKTKPRTKQATRRTSRGVFRAVDVDGEKETPHDRAPQKARCLKRGKKGA